MPNSVSKITRLIHEDGLFLVLLRFSGVAFRRIRNGFIARRLATSGLHIGRSPRLGGLAHINVGHGVTAGDAFWLEAVTRFAGLDFNPAIRIGQRCSFSDRVHIGATTAVTLGDDVLCGSNVIIIDHAHGTYSGPIASQSSPDIPPNTRALSEGRPVVIGDRVWIGDNVAVLPGSRIGAGAIIGANSVVTGEIPANTIAFGSPARPVRRWDSAAAAWVPISPPPQTVHSA